MKKVKILYALVVFFLTLVSLPPLTIAVGLKFFCTESFFSLYLGEFSKANSSLIFFELVGFLILPGLIHITNKEIYKITKPVDDLLEDNLTVIKNNDKYRLEFSYAFPTFLSFILAILSYYNVYDNCGLGLFFLIIVGVIQAVIAFVSFYNNIHFIMFLNNEEK